MIENSMIEKNGKKMIGVLWAVMAIQEVVVSSALTYDLLQVGLGSSVTMIWVKSIIRVLLLSGLFYMILKGKKWASVTFTVLIGLGIIGYMSLYLLTRQPLVVYLILINIGCMAIYLTHGGIKAYHKSLKKQT